MQPDSIGSRGYAPIMATVREIPTSPRIPASLADVSNWSLADELVIADSQVGGDFSGQSATGVVFERCRISNAQLTGAILNRLRCTDVLVDRSVLSGADLDESSFTRVEFRDCRMSGVLFSRCTFADVLVSTSRLEEASFRMSRTKAVLFQDVDLHDGDFYAATLEDTRFFDCNLTGAEFSKATLPGVRFHGSTLFDLKGSQYLAGAVIDSSQVLPLGLGLLSAHNIAVENERDPSPSTDRGGR
jgi:uncharacterized protein YjbI with pentapeptide repeats